MGKINMAITGVGGYVPDYILDNEEICKMVDTSDEWIMARIGVKTRHLLKEKGKGSAYLGYRAVENLLEKTGVAREDIELIICATVTPDMMFPNNSSLIIGMCGLKNAIPFDLSAACSGFIFGLHTAQQFIKAGTYKKIILVGADKMSSITDYTDRATCPIFGDGGGAVLLEPTEEGVGILDVEIKADAVGCDFLYQKAGGSLYPASKETVENKEHYLYQDGPTVYKFAVTNMSNIAAEIMERNNLTPETLSYLVPHQANLRIIEAARVRMDLPKEKCMINITRYGNTTAACIPLCLWDYEHLLKKGDNIILASFGGGFNWGSIYIKWAYTSEKRNNKEQL